VDLVRPQDVSLEGRVAVVTGAGRGFGAQIAADLAALGAAVAVLDINQDAADESADAINAEGGTSLAVTCDISDASAMVAAAAMIEQALGPAEILVNNAGIASLRPFLETTEDEWERVFAVNYNGMFHACKAFVPHMTRIGRGRIVNLSSIAGKRGGGFLGTSAYSAAKVAVIGFTRALALELRPSGILVNCVAPGAMDTEMTAVLREKPDLLAKVVAGIPLGRRGTVQDVADAVVFLCTDLASHVVGEALNVDGGVMME